MDHSFVCPLDHNSFISGLVALQPVGSGGFVANEALVTLQHEDGSVDEIEVILGVLIHGSIAVGEQMS